MGSAVTNTETMEIPVRKLEVGMVIAQRAITVKSLTPCMHTGKVHVNEIRVGPFHMVRVKGKKVQALNPSRGRLLSFDGCYTLCAYVHVLAVETATEIKPLMTLTLTDA